MSIANELVQELFRGIDDGRREAIEEAPYLTKVAGLRNPNVDAMYSPIHVTALPERVLGQTGIKKDGEVAYVAVSKDIPYFVTRAMQTYNKSLEWAKATVYRIAKLTTEHELAHAQSSRVAKGEDVNGDAVSVMESITTYAKHKVAKMLGKLEKADHIEKTNPYPGAWMVGKLADWAPYSGPSGMGYAALVMDAQKEPFYKPLWRLTKSAIGGRNMKEMPAYAA
jgi:hypothetical protein